MIFKLSKKFILKKYNNRGVGVDFKLRPRAKPLEAMGKTMYDVFVILVVEKLCC